MHDDEFEAFALVGDPRGDAHFPQRSGLLQVDREVVLGHRKALGLQVRRIAARGPRGRCIARHAATARSAEQQRGGLYHLSSRDSMFHRSLLLKPQGPARNYTDSHARCIPPPDGRYGRSVS